MTFPAVTDKEELRRIAEAGHVARMKLQELEREEERQQNAKLVGSCYKYRNCYSCPETEADYWWMFAKVTGLDEFGELIVFTFQVDKNGCISIDPAGTTPAGYLQTYTPITRTQFAEEWQALRCRLTVNP